jgi:8-oxo-dGTP pyrophosphatase MutT (NUDIX family)
MSSSRTLPALPDGHPADACGRPLVERVAGRVLVVDDRGRLLLFQGFDPTNPAAGSWWFTVGGGAEGAETVVECTLCELVEETGIEATAEALIGPVLTHDAEFDFLDVHLLSHETVFAVRVPVCEVRPRFLTDIERRTVLGHRWWSVAELRATDEAVHPAGLADVLSELLAAGPAALPRTAR